MMETVLNVGLNEKTAQGIITTTGNPRFVYDAYRRLIQMYSDVVMEKAEGIEPAEGMGIRQQLERELEKMKRARGVKQDTELTADDLKSLIRTYKAKVREVLGKDFPEDAMEQVWGGVRAVFQSWNGKRAISYRRIEGIPDEWGTAVTVQSMVFGNMGEDSGTGVAFTRNPATGENVFYGEWLPNAQGEDVVAGIRTPYPINEAGKTEHTASLPSLEKQFSKIYAELHSIELRLERHYHDMLDLEFTIEKGKLWMLQCRVGKRNGPAAVRMAVDMVREKLTTPEVAVTRVTAAQLDELLHPIIDPVKERATPIFVKGLPAGPGGAVGDGGEGGIEIGMRDAAALARAAVVAWAAAIQGFGEIRRTRQSDGAAHFFLHAIAEDGFLAGERHGRLELAIGELLESFGHAGNADIIFD
jgi:pyruvate,orthophosphate dikinase